MFTFEKEKYMPDFWLDKIKEGMELIAAGCDENKDAKNCVRCPMDRYCNVIMDASELPKYKDLEIPECWYH